MADWFDDDPFESIVREFLGNSGSKRVRKNNQVISGEEEDRNLDFIETKDNFYLIAELPGFSEKELMIVIKGQEIQITANKKKSENIQSYLQQKLQEGQEITKVLPKNVKTKNFKKTMKNGVLEITFNK